jgi:hypothetical protein
MNDKDYFNYFNFMKNLKNSPDNGMSPLAEWNSVIKFFSQVYAYLEDEWSINLDSVIFFCEGDTASFHNHRRSIADIVVRNFRKFNNVSNTAVEVIQYLRNNSLIN